MLFSVSRRFSLATLFVFVTAYAALLGIMWALRVPALITLDAVIFVTAVGLSQAILFGGRMPRRASIISGGIVAGVLAGGQSYWYLLDPNYPEGLAWAPYIAIGFAITAAAHGLLLGYVVGALIGLLFVWADYLFRALIPDSKPSDEALAEVKRRWAEHEAGSAKAIPWEEASREINRKLAGDS